MATRSKRKKVSVKEMRFSHDPMIRFYDKTQEWLQEKGRPFVIGLGIVAGLILIYVVGSYFLEYRKANASKRLCRSRREVQRAGSGRKYASYNHADGRLLQ